MFNNLLIENFNIISMRTRRFYLMLFFSISVILFSNCQLKKMVQNQDKITYNAKPDAAESRGGKSTVAVQGTFPEKYFAKKATMTTTPSIRNSKGEVVELSPINFQGEKAKASGQVINYKYGSEYKSLQDIPYSPNFENSTLVLNSTIKKGKKEIPLNEKEIGKVKLGTKRQEIDPKLGYKGQTSSGPTYLYTEHNYKAYDAVEQTATIYFDFNSDALNWNLAFNKKEENKQALKNLFPFVMEYDSVKSVDIDGWASPEGELKRNMELANSRSSVAQKWFQREFKKYLDNQSKEMRKVSNSIVNSIQFNLYDRGEDWDGFIAAVRKSSISDKDKVINVIQSQATKDQKEQQIRNMIAIYDEIDQEILPSLRRAHLKVTCLINLRSDEEINKLASSTPDSLSLNELLYAATLTDDLTKKKEIYTKATELYPNDYRAYNNLGCLSVADDNLDKAKELFEKANDMESNNDIVLNNLGIISYQEQDYSKAETYFVESEKAGMDQSENLGLVKDTIYTIEYIPSTSAVQPSQEAVQKAEKIRTKTEKPVDQDKAVVEEAEAAKVAEEAATEDTKVKREKAADKKAQKEAEEVKSESAPAERGEFNRAIKLNALTLIGAPGIAYEIKFAKHFSVQAEAVGTYYKNGFLGTDKPLRLISGFAQVRYYPKEVFRGFFVGLNVGFGYYDMARAIIPNHWNEKYDGVNHEGWNIMTGLTLGWAFPIKERWVIEPFVSGGLTYSNYDNYVNGNLVTRGKRRYDFPIAYNGGVYVAYKFNVEEKTYEREENSMAIKLNALTLVGAPGLAYEIKISKHFSGQIEAVGTYYPNGFLGTDKPIKLISGFLQARYYPKYVFNGFFAGINVGFGAYNMARQIIPNFWNEDFDGSMHKGWNAMGGLTLGWSFPIKTHWGIEPFISTGYTYAKYDNYLNETLVSSKTRDLITAYNGGVYVYYKF